MINITDRTIAIWYVQLGIGERGSDWLASIWRDDDGIKGTYRFRYYRGDQSLQFEDSQDVKHWVELDLCEYTEEKTIHVMRVMAESLADLSGGEKWELMMGTGTVTQFMDEYKKLPFVTFKVEKVKP